MCCPRGGGREENDRLNEELEELRSSLACVGSRSALSNDNKELRSLRRTNRELQSQLVSLHASAISAQKLMFARAESV